jgi:long-chain fatty acid transport protein
MSMICGRLCGFTVALTVMTLALATNTMAQSNDEVFPQFQWNFSTPGARANGMGRTFIGMADDATATVTNPAGLVSLTKPQLYLEYKNTDLRVQRLAAVDALRTLQPTTFNTHINSLSFLSISTPLGTRFAVGFSLNRFLDYQETLHLAARAIPGDLQNGAFSPVQGTADFNAMSYIGTVAYAVTDQLRLGFSVAGNHLKAQSRATRFGVLFGTNYPARDLNDLSESATITNETTIDQTDNSASWGVGALYRPNERVSIGLNYAKGPSFSVAENRQVNPGFVNTRPPACCGPNLPLVTSANFPKTVTIDVPDRFGIGVSARPHPRMLVGVDVVRINYSSLAKNFVPVFFESVLTGSEFSIKNSTEVHVGGEYTLSSGKTPFFVRAGVFSNPDHSTTFSGSSDQDVNQTEAASFNLLPRETQVKGTIGFGAVLGSRLQIDLAYVWRQEFVASTGVRF